VGVAVIFPGQGTQEPGMGSPWRDHPAWRVIEEAETAFGEPLGDLVLEATAEELARTRAAQLAVLLTSLLAWEAVKDRLHEPIAFAGHSLGQVTALIAAGVVPLDAGIRFAARRAELTQAAADAHPGRMAALLGATLEQADAACAAAPGECWIANDNAPGQIVIAGTPAGVDAASATAREAGVRRVTPLNVGGAFHTPLMADAEPGLRAELATIPLRAPDAVIVSNADARAYDDAEGWRERLPVHPQSPVRWRESMATMVELGVTGFLEVGHGSMLASLAKRTTPDVPVRGIGTPDECSVLTEVA